MQQEPMTPTLSIVVPVLNEEEVIDDLLACLQDQQGIDFELLLCDGGSTDGIRSRVEAFSTRSPFPIELVSCPKGRARQLNAGALLARGCYILFLHADSQFRHPRALSRAVADLCGAMAGSQDRCVAGHFRMRFSRCSPDPSFAYFYYEAKARIDRTGCTHGDQGFLFSRDSFARVGPFDETVPVLEDTLLADKIRRCGRWQLLPDEIWTSGRRFETEGMAPRQTLNALIMNFSSIGWDAFFNEARQLYRQQDRCGRLHLTPYFRKIRSLLGELPRRQRFRLWYATGGFVRSHAWQIAFWAATRKTYSRGLCHEEVNTGSVDRFALWFDRLTDNPPCRLAAAGLTWGWFHLLLQLLPGWEKAAPSASSSSE